MEEMKSVDKISIVIPCYNEEDVLLNFYEETKKVMQTGAQRYQLDFEMLFVDDGSKDTTAAIIKELHEKDGHVEFLSFSRNFGKESAIYAGLQFADGDYTVIMDADLQHPPEVILQMYEEMKSGRYDMIATRRKNRSSDTKIRAAGAKMFYKVMNKISGIDMGNNAMDFRMLNHKTKNAILSMGEYNRFSKGIFEWVGFRTCWLEIEIPERKAGTSKWSFVKLFRYSLEGCMAFSTLPLALSSFIGFALCLIAVLMIIIMVVQTMITGVEGSGYATIICTILLVGGVQLFCIGILGQYLSKAYLEVKRRPKFLIQDLSEKKRGIIDRNVLE